jgi:hypothetical protein
VIAAFDALPFVASGLSGLIGAGIGSAVSYRVARGQWRHDQARDARQYATRWDEARRTAYVEVLASWDHMLNTVMSMFHTADPPVAEASRRFGLARVTAELLAGQRVRDLLGEMDTASSVLLLRVVTERKDPPGDMDDSAALALPVMTGPERTRCDALRAHLIAAVRAELDVETGGDARD